MLNATAFAALLELLLETELLELLETLELLLEATMLLDELEARLEELLELTELTEDDAVELTDEELLEPPLLLSELPQPLISAASKPKVTTDKRMTDPF